MGRPFHLDVHIAWSVVRLSRGVSPAGSRPNASLAPTRSSSSNRVREEEKEEKALQEEKGKEGGRRKRPALSSRFSYAPLHVPVERRE